MTNIPDDPHEVLAESISDGDRVDWDQAETSPGVDAAMARALRDVERIARFSAQTQSEPFAARQSSAAVSTKHPHRWGDLTLLEIAGGGTRGEVWRAWDPTLQRQVALKFLQPTLETGGAGATQALLREARSLARVHHPNVATVFGIAEHEGLAGMWMEFLGGTLAGEIERTGALAPREVVRIGVALCSALEALEATGLVHRDIKPANIALQPDGRVALMDFGLGQQFTAPVEGRSSGTPVFMAPELLAGGPATNRSDLYALGVTLWWAAAGRPPFQAGSIEELKVQVEQGPTTRLRDANRGIPRALASAIEWAMNRDPGARPRSATQLGAKLRGALRETGTSHSHRRWALGLSAAGIVAAITITLYVTGRLHPFAGAPASPPTLAVLPMVNRTGDSGQEYITDGMTDELIARLAQVGGLRVTSYASIAPFKNSKLSIPEIGKKLHATMVVETSANSIGDRLHVSATLVDASSGQVVWGQVYERRAEEAYTLEGDLASSVADHVAVHLTPSERSHLKRGPELNPTAHTLYLRGLAAFREQSAAGTLRAIELFRGAIAIDSTYADAWARLAYACDWASTYGHSEYDSLGEAAAWRAVALDHENGPAIAIATSRQLGRDRDFVAAERGYRDAISRSPGDVDARIELVSCLTAMGRFDEAAAEARRARESDPLSSVAAEASLFPLFEGRRYGEAVRVARELLKGDPNNTNISFNLGQALYFSGQRPDGIATMERVVQVDPFPEAVAWLGLMHGLSGDVRAARAMLVRLERMDRVNRIDPYCLAIAHVGLGDRDAALNDLARALIYHRGSIVLLRVDPALDPLRNDPRFLAMAKQFRVEP